MKETKILCPKCKSQLNKDGEKITCKNCFFTGRFQKGFHDFPCDEEYYLRGIEREEMKLFLKTADEKGWKHAVKNISFKYPNLREYIQSYARSDWLFHCLDNSKLESCLDIGSGYGTNVFSLAKYFNEVWSIEGVTERIQFQKIRRDQEKIENIHLVRSDWLNIPFLDESFDLISLNGALEWIGLSDYSKNPREMQIEFLKQLHNTLKPDGCLYVGIENRFGYNFFLGGTDHSGIPYTSIVPRKIADCMVRGKNRKDRGIIKNWPNYRTYSYSYWGYKNLLKEAGFNRIRIYWTLNYNHPKYAGLFDGESFSFLLKYFKNDINEIKTLGNLMSVLGSKIPKSLIKLALPIFCPCFLIFAYKNKKNTSFESKLLQIKPSNSSFLRVSGGHGTTSKVNYFLLNEGRLQSVLKFPRFKNSNQLGLEEEKMKFYNKMEIEKRNVDSIDVYVEPAIRGAPFRLYDLKDNQKVLNWLLDFQTKTQQGFWEFNQFKKKVMPLFDVLSELPLENTIKTRTREKIDLFLKTLRTIKIPKNSEHGDFVPCNIIIGKDKKIYVIDWEFYKIEGDPFFDFVFYILKNAYRDGNIMFKKNFCETGRYYPILVHLISEFLNSKDMSKDLIFQAVPYTLLRCIHRASVESDMRHLSINKFTNILEQWDEIFPFIDIDKFSNIEIHH